MDPNIEYDKTLDLRLLNVFTSDIDSRVRDLTTLVSLQESELTLLWFTIMGLFTIVLLKGNSNGR